MKAVSIIAVLLLLAVNAVAFWPMPASVQPYLGPYLDLARPYLDLARPYLPQTALGLGLIALIAILARRSARRGESPDISSRPAAEAARPVPALAAVPPPPRDGQGAVDVAGFLAALQEKGRLVDFLMDDINAADDASVGAAARVIHAGCKAVLLEYFRITPLRAEAEGARVQVPPGTAADEVRLIGKIGGAPPFSGVLVHHGWKAEAAALPRIARDPSGRLPAIAPAEVELT